MDSSSVSKCSNKLCITIWTSKWSLLNIVLSDVITASIPRLDELYEFVGWQMHYITLLILNWIYSHSFDQKVCLNSACLAQFLKFLDATNCFGINDKSPFINETTARCRCLAPSSSPLFCAFLSMAMSSNMIHSFWVVPSSIHRQHRTRTVLTFEKTPRKVKFLW